MSPLLFWNDEKLVNLSFQSLKSISDSDRVFAKCASLQSIDFPTLKSISKSRSIFEGCTSLQSIVFPSLLELSENNRMFFDCNSLSSVEFPKLSSIDELTISFMFGKCKSLKTLKMPTISSNEFPEKWQTTFKECTLPLSIYINNVDSASIGNLPNAIPRGSTIVCKDKTITTT